MSDDDAPSFVRGIFAGAIHDTLLFPFPSTLDERNPEETRTVRRLLAALERMSRGLIDPARFDEEETIPDEVIEALAAEGFLGISIPREYGGLGLSPAAYSHVFGAVSSLDPSIGVLLAVHAGFRVVGTVRKMGIRGSTQAELAYEGLRVPADHVLGTVGKGFTIAVNALNAGRMSLAAGCTTGTKRILAQMNEFTEQRVQFGRPIADFEITQ